MGGFDKFLDFLKIDRDDEYDDEYEEDVEEAEPKLPAFPKNVEEPEKEEKFFKKPVSNNSRARKGGNQRMEVTRVKPVSIEDGRKITKLLLEGKVVFLDLEGIDYALAQRIIDYVSGANFAIDGTLSPMSKSTFVIAPPAVYVSGDLQDANSGGDGSVSF